LEGLRTNIPPSNLSLIAAFSNEEANLENRLLNMRGLLIGNFFSISEYVVNFYILLIPTAIAERISPSANDTFFKAFNKIFAISNFNFSVTSPLFNSSSPSKAVSNDCNAKSSSAS
jgi:hypothetical protein